MVVAGHPEAAAIGVEVLREGGNAVDAAVAVSLALGVAEPYASGLGGKFLMLYYEASSGHTYVVDAMDAAPSSLDAEAARAWTSEERHNGWKSVCVPGLAAGLELAHARWGSRPWADNVAPSITLANEGFTVLEKTLSLFEEKIDRLEGDPELSRIFLPHGALPALGSRIVNPDLASTLEHLARDGAKGFYKGPVAKRIAEASQAGGGVIDEADLAAYSARIVEPVELSFGSHTLVGGPPPSTGCALYFPVLAALDGYAWPDPAELRTAENLRVLGDVWCANQPKVYATIGDTPEAREAFADLFTASSLEALRAAAELAPSEAVPALEDAPASTTHFAIIDSAGNIVCATQSLSLHFGAGVIAPGTGVILNDTMSNFAYQETENPNAVAPGKRPRSTISPTIIFENGQPKIAIGLPGGSRIPTAMLQAVLDRLVFERPLDEAIGALRFHINPAARNGGVNAIETEAALPDSVAARLEEFGWSVETVEPAGTGRYFGGLNAIEINPDGSLTGYADPRRTNAAAGF